MMRWHRYSTKVRALMALGVLTLAAAPTAAALAAGLAEPPVMAAAGPILGVTKESGGAVTVILTPERLRDGRLEVEIRVNTHTVNDLEKYDLTKITALAVEGKAVRPVSAPKLKGHHNSGTLVFPLQAMPESFSIEIRGLDKPELRVLSWP